MAKENLIRSNKCRWVLTPEFSKLECEVKPDKHHFLSSLPFVNQNVDQIKKPHVFMPNRSMQLMDGQTRTSFQKFSDLQILAYLIKFEYQRT